MKRVIDFDTVRKYCEDHKRESIELSYLSQITFFAEPAVVAHWTFKEEDYPLLEEGGIPYNMWCSNCGCWHSNDDYEDKYCSCCGAKMDETHINELKGVYSNE